MPWTNWVDLGITFWGLLTTMLMNGRMSVMNLLGTRGLLVRDSNGNENNSDESNGNEESARDSDGNERTFIENLIGGKDSV